MEVLDPSVSRDDQPLCINDSLEKGLLLIFHSYIYSKHFSLRVIEIFYLTIMLTVVSCVTLKGIVWKQRIDRARHEPTTYALSAVKASGYVILFKFY